MDKKKSTNNFVNVLKENLKYKNEVLDSFTNILEELKNVVEIEEMRLALSRMPSLEDKSSSEIKSSLLSLFKFSFSHIQESFDSLKNAIQDLEKYGIK